MSLILRILFIFIFVAIIGGFLYFSMMDLPIAQETVVKEVQINNPET